MTKNLYVVLIPVNSTNNGRKIAEHIENTEFDTFHVLLNAIKAKNNGEEVEDLLVYQISDYMDEVNNQTLDDLTEYWLSYVIIKNYL